MTSHLNPPPAPAAPTLCVFCGASVGLNPVFREAAAELGRTLARRGITLVYGGGSIGLMGAVADAALAQGGQVIGVITRLLHEREVGHNHLTAMHIVETMHERKKLMADLAGGFVVLPGGYGTLDELFEIIAWAQLGIHAKPIGLLNAAHFYDNLLGFLDHAGKEGFLRLDHRAHLFADATPDTLVDAMLRQPMLTH